MRITLLIATLLLAGCGAQFAVRAALDPFPSLTVTANADTTYLLAMQRAAAAATQPQGVKP